MKKKTHKLTVHGRKKECKEKVQLLEKEIVNLDTQLVKQYDTFILYRSTCTTCSEEHFFLKFEVTKSFPERLALDPQINDLTGMIPICILQ